MRKLSVGLAVLAFLAVPHLALAQDADDAQDGPPPTGVVTMSTMKVPFTDRGDFMDYVEQVLSPLNRANPHVMAFYVLTHFHGSDARDVVLVSVHKDWASVEEPCGEPCQEWWAANVPEAETPEREEWQRLQQVYAKYNSRHSDEIYSARLDLAKN